MTRWKKTKRITEEARTSTEERVKTKKAVARKVSKKSKMTKTMKACPQIAKKRRKSQVRKTEVSVSLQTTNLTQKKTKMMISMKL